MRSDPVQRQRVIDRLFQQEDVNFLLTNRIPRKAVTRFIGWFSRIEQPLVRDMSLRAFKFFAGDPQLHEARKAQFISLHDCFVRELKEGARPIDTNPNLIISPCDGIVGACGRLRGDELLQAKQFAYTLGDLLGDSELVERCRDGAYVTIRLTASMYHRFHAPADCRVAEVRYIAGDAWNVNPVALNRVARLFCRNERAVVPLNVSHSSESLVLVPVGAILVASIRFNFLAEPLTLRYRGPNRIDCRASFRRGDEMGYFEHGSTVIVIGSAGLSCADNVRPGERIRVGEPLLRHS